MNPCPRCGCSKIIIVGRHKGKIVNGELEFDDAIDLNGVFCMKCSRTLFHPNYIILEQDSDDFKWEELANARYQELNITSKDLEDC